MLSFIIYIYIYIYMYVLYYIYLKATRHAADPFGKWNTYYVLGRQMAPKSSKIGVPGESREVQNRQKLVSRGSEGVQWRPWGPPRCSRRYKMSPKSKQRKLRTDSRTIFRLKGPKRAEWATVCTGSLAYSLSSLFERM